MSRRNLKHQVNMIWQVENSPEPAHKKMEDYIPCWEKEFKIVVITKLKDSLSESK